MIKVVFTDQEATALLDELSYVYVYLYRHQSREDKQRMALLNRLGNTLIRGLDARTGKEGEVNL